MGRPSLFTETLAERICALIASGKSLRRICEEEEGMPTAETVRTWLLKHEGFSAQYARAREVQAEHYADEIVEIADTEADAAKARVRVDARKWTASKLLPKKYGERIEQVHSGSIQTQTDEQVQARFAELLAKAKGDA